MSLVVDLRADMRALMRSVAATVAIVTARSQTGPVGMTATSITSVSLDPPAILVCVNRSARLHAAITERGLFRVNYLAQEHERVADTFGGPNRNDRFASGSWETQAPFGPRLGGALAQMACRLVQAIDHGSHTIFIGSVESVENAPAEPLLYCKGSYVALAA